MSEHDDDLHLTEDPVGKACTYRRGDQWAKDPTFSV
jgi:hypothetical protein